MQFLRDNWRWLAAGALLTGGSGFGQTYFISLFAGEIRGEFGLSHGQWGLIYTAGTMISAMVMLWGGQLADRFTVTQISSVIMGLFAVTCLAMALNTTALGLIAIIFGLRFCGQGMMGHIALVAAGRWYASNRGRAVSIMSLGYAVAEAIFPILFVALVVWMGWRNTWILAAGITLSLIPILHRLMAVKRRPKGIKDNSDTVATVGMANRHWTRRDAISHRLFWLTLPAFMAMPVFSTSLFFQQVHLSELKGWELASWVAMIPILTASTIMAMLISGPLIDRFGSGRFLGFHLIPAVLAFLVLWQASSFWAIAMVFVLMGTTQGIGGNLAGTFFPDYYGTNHLGAIRSIATSTMVFGSAIGPGATGVLIDLGWSFEDQAIGISVIMATAASLAIYAIRLERNTVSAAV